MQAREILLVLMGLPVKGEDEGEEEEDKEEEDEGFAIMKPNKQT